MSEQERPSPIRKRLLLAIPLLILLALGLLFKVNLGRDTKLVPSPFIGKSMPAFNTVDLLSGAPISTQSLAGQAFVLNVWASWCATCRLEHGVFNQYQKTESALPIVGLNYKDVGADAKRWLDALGNPYQQIAVDADGKIGLDLGVYGAPETYFVDSSGIVRYKHIGEITMEIMLTQSKTLRDQSVQNTGPGR
jgi:cytochrome c biogenesis protein CcmG, thiol:disulfide interchange protein DsbE